MKSLILALFLAPLLALLAPVQDAQETPDPHPVDTKRRFRMGTSDAFKKVDLEELTVDGGFIFYIQKAYGQNEAYAQRMVDVHLPWLHAAETAFEQLFGGPLGIDAGAEREPIAIVIMNSEGDFLNYLGKGISKRCRGTRNISYNPRLATITLAALTSAPNKAGQNRQAELVHNAVHALWQAYSHKVDELSGPTWLTEGSAMYIAAAYGKQTKDFKPGEGLDKYLAFLAEALAQGGFEKQWLVPLKQLLIKDGGTVPDKNLSNRLLAKSQLEYSRAIWARTCALPMFFSYVYGDQKLKPLLQQYIPHALQDTTGINSFESHLGDTELRTLEIGYWKQVLKTYKAKKPSFDINRVRGPDAVMAAARSLGAQVASTPSAALDSTASDVNADPTSLQGPNWDGAAIHAQAIFQMSLGRFQSATDLMIQLRKDQGGSMPAELEETQRMLQGLVDLRMDFLEGLSANNGRIKLQLDGKKVSAKVDSISNGVLHFQPSKRKQPSEFAIDAIPLADFSNQVLRARPPLATDEQRAMIEIMLGEERWDRTLNKRLGTGNPQVASIAARAQLQTSGHVVDLIDGLYSLHRSTPTVPAAIMAQIESLADVDPNHDYVLAHKASILGIAREALTSDFDDEALMSALHASKIVLDGDMLYLEYDFEDEQQWLDFASDPKSLIARPFLAGKSVVPPEEHYARLQDGELRLRGKQSVRHCVPLLPPFKASYSSLSHYDEGGDLGTMNSSAIGFCDNLKQTNILCSSYPLWIMVNGGKLHDLKTQDPGGSKLFDTEYKMDFSFVDGQVTCISEVNDPLSLTTELKPRGYTHLIGNTTAAVGFTEFMVEGRIDQAARDEIAQRVADDELKRLGFL